MAFSSQPIDFDKRKKFPPAKSEYGTQKVDEHLMTKIEITEPDKWELKSIAYKQGLTLQSLLGRLAREYISLWNDSP